MKKFMIVMICASSALLPAVTSAADKDAWFAKAVKSVESTIEPAEAKPGSTVTLKLTVTLEPGYHTYPLVQIDPQAGDMVNTLKFPEKSALIFVGSAFDPAEPKTKSEPILGIKELHYYTGKVMYERRAVVSPKAKVGEVSIVIPEFRLSVCDKDNCFPPKKLMPEAKFKVLDGTVPVDAKYAEEVEKALKNQ